MVIAGAAARGGDKLLALTETTKNSSSCSSSVLHENKAKKPQILTKIGGIKRRKMEELVDQHKRHQSSGPKPQKMKQIRRSNFELFFGAIFGRNW
jgi:hypothetical protein